MKWIFRIFATLLAAFVVLVGSLLLLPADRFAKIAVDQLSAATGRDVAINGGISLTLWPVLGVRAQGLEVGNAGWAEKGPMLQAENAAIGIDPMSLLSGEIRITNIEAQSPTLRLAQRRDGRASWEFTDSSGEAQIETSTAPDKPARPVSIERLVIRDAALIYDAEGSDLVAYEGVDLTLDWPERTGPAQIEARVSPAQSSVSVRATIDGFAGFIAGDVRTLRAEITTEAGDLTFDGRASTTGAVAGDVRLKTDTSDAFLKALGFPGANLPPKLGKSINLNANLTLTPDRKLALRDIDVDLSGNRLTGELDASLNGIPDVVARLDAGALDLSSAKGGGEAGSGSASGGSSAPSGWSRDDIDASGLANFNGAIEVKASSVDLGQFQLGTTRAVLRNDNSRMVFELRDVVAYGGLVGGEFVVNNRNGLSVGGQMAANSIQMQPLLSDAIDLDRLTGKGDVQLSFLGVGPSVYAIMNSLSGSGSLGVARGTIEGIDLDRLLRGDTSGSGTTIFDDLTATWKIEGGVLSNRDLLFQLKNYRASGEGTLGLGARNLDYTFTPVALRANSGRGVSIPVRFVGPWDNVSIRPDVEAALEAELEAEAEEIKQKALDKINEKLGITSGEGGSTEDQIKDQLLRKLFD